MSVISLNGMDTKGEFFDDSIDEIDCRGLSMRWVAL
jgi:hypothetical protein